MEATNENTGPKQLLKFVSAAQIYYWFLSLSQANLRHNAREVEHLSWQVGHVAVHKDKKWLDDTCVGGEARGEGGQDPVDGSHKNTTQSNHQEGDDSQETVHHSHDANTNKLLEEVI